MTTAPADPGDAFTRTLDRLTALVGRAVAWLIVPMVLGLVYEVVARYLFNAPTEWAYDLTYMLYGTLFMLGSAYTLQVGGHIRTDSFYGQWSERRKAVVDAICYCVFLLPPMIVFMVLGWDYFWRSFQQNERIVTSPWLPIVWPFKFVIPLAAALLVLQGVAELVKSVRVALRAPRAEPAP